MAGQCPLIFRQVDATVTRVNTLFVMCGVIAFLAVKVLWIPLLLILDFSLRLYGQKHLSPIQNSSLWIQRKFKLPSKMEDAGAKRLAAFFGVGFMIALVLLQLIQSELGIAVVAAVYLFCAALDLFFGFCIACKIYHIGRKLYRNEMV